MIINIRPHKKNYLFSVPARPEIFPDLKIYLFFFFKKPIHIWCKNSKNNIFLVEKKLKWRISPEQVMFNVMYCIHSCTQVSTGSCESFPGSLIWCDAIFVFVSMNKTRLDFIKIKRFCWNNGICCMLLGQGRVKYTN